ncbi:MAG: hypothetical protein ISS48_03650 [Candidatus Aenigmarchaeota archaeon]|nr:hypothetical protein [Candidatus Aenigmarchaeota archaeon]
MKKKLIVFLLVIIFIGGFLVWYFWLQPRTWKTYRNEEYGFEIKYPGNYKIEERVLDDRFVIYFYSEVAQPLPSLTIFGNKNMSEKIKEIKNNPTMSITKDQTIEIDSEGGKRLTGKDLIHPILSVDFVLFEKDGQLYLLSGIDDRMLATFKFLE